MKILFTLCFAVLTALPVLAGVTPWMELKIENGHISIPITISGIETKAIIDTGSQINALNSAFRNKNELSFGTGQNYKLKGVHGTEMVNSFNQVPVNLFGAEMKLDGLADISLGHHSTGLLLGAGFLEQFVLQIDYPNQRIRFVTHGVLKMSELQNIDFQLQKGSGMPIVKVGLGEDKSAWVLFDTGNSGGLLFNKSMADTMGWHDTLSAEQSLSKGATSHVAVMDNYRVPEVVFGPYTLEHVLVSIPADDSRIFQQDQYKALGSNIRGKKIQGILGYDILQHFVLTVDYKNGYAHVGLPEEG